MSIEWKLMKLYAAMAAALIFILFSSTVAFWPTPTCCSVPLQTDSQILDHHSQSPENPTGEQEPRREVSAVVKETGSQVIAQSIIYLRDLALEKSKPIPLDIKHKLTPYFATSILEKVRYSVDWSPLIRSALQKLMDTDHFSLAVTLDNVIVFSDDGGIDDLWLWAHELKHVEQYDRWGVQTFVRNYLQNHQQVEQEAHDYADYVFRRIMILTSTRKKNP